jgi:hypothetical protein
MGAVTYRDGVALAQFTNLNLDERIGFEDVKTRVNLEY